ncbi:MAG TPA: hypothetical protein VGI05_18385 [Streptosporangiaceae bacterium]
MLQRDLRQREQILERQQANYVELELKTYSGGLTGVPAAVTAASSNRLVLLAAVTNTSDRPVRQVTCRLNVAGQAPALPTRLGQIAQDRIFQAATPQSFFNSFADGSTFGVIRAQTSAGFAFPVTAEDHPGAQVEARFTDDAGLHWQIDNDLHLHKLPNRDDW